MSFAVLLHSAHPAEPVHVARAPVMSRIASTGVISKHPKGTTAAALGFVEYLPAGYGVGKTKAPLLLAFHGKGENGPGTSESLERLNNNGITKMMHEGEWPAERPFVVLAPQHDGGGCPTAPEINKFLRFAKAHYKIDDRRVYLTGLSCGARGIADYFAHYGARDVAATVLISGDLSPAYAKLKCSLAEQTPIWLFHGEDDDIVPLTGDAATMDDLRACPNHREMKMDVYPNTGHDAWTRAYRTAHHDVFSWLLEYKSDDRSKSAHK